MIKRMRQQELARDVSSYLRKKENRTSKMESIMEMIYSERESVEKIVSEFACFQLEEDRETVTLVNRYGIESTEDILATMKALFPSGLHRSDLWGSYSSAVSDLEMLLYKKEVVESNDYLYYLPPKREVSSLLFQEGRRQLREKKSRDL